MPDSNAFSGEEISPLDALLRRPAATALVERIWASLSEEFRLAQERMPARPMARQELSFHPYVKLLGYLSLDARDLEGALVEIGVWKGKSLALMSRAAGQGSTVVGIDPCELEGQEQELDYFHQAIFPECRLVRAYSHYAIEQVVQLAPKLKLLHIDGGHSSAQVWADFLLYERFVVESGYIVFDDYGDAQYSPEVGPAVDRLRQCGLFAGYHVLGQPAGYQNSYVLKRRSGSSAV